MTMVDMLSCVETGEEFFDSVDHLTAENSGVGDIGNEFWRKELKSVKERRAAFLHEMDFVESCSSSGQSDDLGSLTVMGLKRMEEGTGAVSSSCSDRAEECDALFLGRECDGNAQFAVDEWDDEHPIRESISTCEDDAELLPCNGHREQCGIVESVNKKIGHLWRGMMSKRVGKTGRCKCDTTTNKFDVTRTKVRVNKKRFKELSALFAAQEAQAHKGIIWAMKFSPDGQYVASGGQDGVVRIWRVKLIDSCLERFHDESSPRNYENTGFKREKNVKVQVVVPDKMFQLEEQPVHEFYGHVGEVLDLAWSDSNCLLSSSTDKTVRMWQVGYDKCLNIFHHTDYVTCVQFNPVDDNCFVSGSLDGKVRIWSVPKGRVLNWADTGDAVTALSYQPDGQGLVVGSLRGNCLCYETKGGLIELTAQFLIQSKRKSSINRITGIQFSPQDSQTIMVMCEDSKLHIFSKMDVVSKYRGLSKSGSQMSAAFTSNGRYIISIGKDSRVYIWNHEQPTVLGSKHKKFIRSCESFYVEGVSVALPWPGTESGQTVSSNWCTEYEADSRAQEPPSFSLRNMFSSLNSATWPEDMLLPIFNQPYGHGQGAKQAVLPPTWGLVIVTANFDGKIRIFHNYGLPVSV